MTSDNFNASPESSQEGSITDRFLKEPDSRVVPVKVYKVNVGVELPAYRSEGASTMELRAYLPGCDLEIPPDTSRAVPTGLHVEVPRGFALQVIPRRRLSPDEEVTVHDTPEIIDSDARKEIQVVLRNNGKQHFKVNHKDVIAQLAIVPVWRCRWVSVEFKSDLSYVNPAGS